MKRARDCFPPLLWGAWLLFLPSPASLADGRTAPPRRTTGPGAKSGRTLHRLPIAFEENRGQFDPRVQYGASGSGFSLLLAPDSILVRVQPHSGGAGLRPLPSATIRIQIRGGDPAARLEGLELLPGVSHYFIGADPGQWRMGVRTYAKVRYRSVYPGVDMAFYGKEGRLEYDFLVAPGADPDVIRLSIEGVDRIAIDPSGDALLETAFGTLRQRKPTVYQTSAAGRRSLDGRYVMRGAREIGFELAKHDPARPLVIDPVLDYSTYLGGQDLDYALGVAVDGQGNACLAGETYSADFPASSGGSGDPTRGNAFVTKLNADGTARLFSTYLGGAEGGDFAMAIAVDSAGNAYITGQTDSADLPVTAGAFQQQYGGGADAFVAKVSPSGSLLYLSYLGGWNGDIGYGIAVDSYGAAYVTGETFSPDFPGLPADGYEDIGDAFVAKVNAAGSALVYSVCLGGADGEDVGMSIAVDAAGGVSVAGRTDATDLAVTPLAFQRQLRGGTDGFVARLDAAGSLLYLTYLGGTGEEYPYALATDLTGNAYVTGETFSADFPVETGSYRTAYGGQGDGFLAKLNAAGSALLYSTYFGSPSGGDIGWAIAVDPSGNAYVAGQSASPDLPVTADALQKSFGGGTTDGFVAKWNAAGSALLYLSYLGAEAYDAAYAVALDARGGVFVAGGTESVGFPISPSAAQRTRGGVDDAFVTKLTFGPATVPVTLQTSPTGLRLGVDGAEYTAPVLVDWQPGSTHTVSVSSPQGSGGTRHIFQSWSDGGTQSHALLAPSAATTYSAVFGTQHSLTVTAGPGGMASPSSAWHNAGQTVNLSATPNSGFLFSGWTGSGPGSYSGPSAAASVTMNAPVTEIASFAPLAGGGARGLWFVPVPPCRVADTRRPQGPLGGPRLAPGETRNFPIPAGSCGIPANARAYSFNISVIPRPTLGFLAIWPAGQPRPVVSTLNSFDGRVKANAALVSAGADGAVSVFASDATDVFLDVNGYFVLRSSAPPDALAFYPVSPCRVADTRLPTAAFGGTLAAGQIRELPVWSAACGIPAGARAYSLNFTVIPRAGAFSFLSTWPAGQAMPVVSTLNAFTGAVTANAAIVPAGPNGSISVYATDAADLLVDVNGYFGPPGNGGLAFYAVAPCRSLDTRSVGGPLLGVRDHQAAAACNLPAEGVYSLNATVIPRPKLSFLTLGPVGGPQPPVSSLNSFDGSVVSNAAIVPASGGLIRAYTTDLTDLILDVNGYFAP